MSLPLTPEQSEAVHFPTRSPKGTPHLVIEAGAGAGKTQVLSARVRWLVAEAPAGIRIFPSRLYLVTFSRSADHELRERVDKQFAQLPGRSGAALAGLIHVSTIDSLFMKLLESKFPSWWENAVRHPAVEHLRPPHSQPPPLEILADDLVTDRLAARLEHLLTDLATTPEIEAVTLDFILSGGFRKASVQLSDHPLLAARQNGSPRFEILKALLSETFLTLPTPHVAIAARKIHPAALRLVDALASLAREEFYRRTLRGEFTQSDKTVFLFNLFCAPAAARAGTPFASETPVTFPVAPSELIVDEYQDTNDVQHDILFRLATAQGGRMVVVGDPKQSIYGFRNARVEVFNRLKRDAQWRQIELRANFRSDAPLLDEINALSQLAFGHRNPRTPDAFWDTDFSKAAEQTFVPARALTAGKATAARTARFSAVTLLGASLNPSRCEDGLVLQAGLGLPEFQLWALARTVREAARQIAETAPEATWSQMVVLCESNARVNLVAQALSRFGIPTLALCSKTQSAGEALLSLANRVAFTLARILIGPVPATHLYELLASPLLGFPHDLINRFLHASRKEPLASRLSWLILPVEPGPSVSQQDSLAPHAACTARPDDPERILEGEEGEDGAFEGFARFIAWVAAAKSHAGIHFFAAWQTLRWRCARASWEPTDLRSETRARAFCADFDGFAQALARLMESPSTRKQCERVAPIFVNARLEDPPLPSSLSHWNLPTVPQESASPNHDSVKVMTIHAAKGLEWPWVFFWPNASREKPVEEFKILARENGRTLKWLMNDVESMSAVSRVDNPSFDALDGIEIAEGPGGASRVGTVWHADLQARTELEFERQRVFYTAFTRARSHLVVVLPPATRRTRKNLRDKIGEVSADAADLLGKAKIASLEESILARYLDERFSLRKPPKRGSKPSEPWFAQDPDASTREGVCPETAAFLDYGPAWYAIFAKEWTEASAPAILVSGAENIQAERPPSSSPDHACDTTGSYDHLGPSGDAPLSWNLATRVPERGVDSVETELQGPRPAAGPAAPTRAEKLQDRRAVAAQGVQYHAAQEHAPERATRSPAFLIRKAALRSFQELEVWSTLQTQSRGLNLGITRPSRHIIDLLSVLPCWNFPDALADFGLRSDSDTVPLRSRLRTFAPWDFLFVVLDYKTGRVSPEHHEQLDHYALLVERLYASEFFSDLLAASAAGAPSTLPGFPMAHPTGPAKRSARARAGSAQDQLPRSPHGEGPVPGGADAPDAADARGREGVLPRPRPRAAVLTILCYDFSFSLRQGHALADLSESVGHQVFAQQFGLVMSWKELAPSSPL